MMKPLQHLCLATTLLSPISVSADENADLKAAYYGLPLVASDDGMMLPVDVDGHEAVMLVDSGSTDIILNALFCKAHKIPVRPTETKAVGFSGEEVPVGRAKVGEVTIGKSITLKMGDLSCFDFTDVHHGQAGLFGYRLLRQLNAVYDMGGNVLYVRR